jgi:hypothetical protein
MDSTAKENPTKVATNKIPTLSKGVYIALSALREAIAVEGEQPPTSEHIPEGIRAVSVHKWRAYAYWWVISSGGARAKQQAFKRAFEKLISTRKVTISEGWVWIS